jgi:arabinogalactan oligomer/maltooligosaccharide transport system permease protein
MRRSLERAEAAALAYPARERRLTLFVAEDSASREVTLRFEPVPVRRIPPPDLGLSAALVSGEWKLVVTPGSVAARAGITDSDAVVSLQGSRLDSMSEFNQRLAEVLRITQPRGPVPVVGPFTVALAVRDTTQASPETRAILLPGTRGAFTLNPPPATNRTDLAFVGLWNYWRILVPSPFSNEARDFYHYLMQTVVWTVTNVALHFVLGLGLALLLNQRIRGRVIYRVVLLLPWAVPVFVSAFAWRFLFNQQGIINQALGWVGIAPIPWLSSAVWTMVAVIVTNVWLGVPFMMVVLLGGLQSIPEEMYEAARVDGANRWQQFWNVTLPLLRPVAVTATLLGVIWTFNMFNVIYLVQGREGRQVEILATLAFRRFYVNQDYGLAAAYGVIILLMLLVFALFYNRALRGTERVWQ